MLSGIIHTTSFDAQNNPKWNIHDLTERVLMWLLNTADFLSFLEIFLNHNVQLGECQYH